MKLSNLINVIKINHLNMIDYDHNVNFDNVAILNYIKLYDLFIYNLTTEK